MATCAECVHVEVCKFKDLPAPLSDSYIRESECIEKRCGNFKNCSRFDAAQFRIKRKPKKVLLWNPSKDHFESGYCCSRCDYEVKQISDDYCPTCGQAIDWN